MSNKSIATVNLSDPSLKITITDPVKTFIGIYLSDESALDRFVIIRCPCGVESPVSIRNFPTENVKHPCDNPDHWTIRYANKDKENA